MPYYIYKVFPDKKLEVLNSYANYKEARTEARALRAKLTAEDTYLVKIIFARNPDEAERLLTEEREPIPMGDD